MIANKNTKLPTTKALFLRRIYKIIKQKEQYKPMYRTTLLQARQLVAAGLLKELTAIPGIFVATKQGQCTVRTWDA